MKAEQLLKVGLIIGMLAMVGFKGYRGYRQSPVWCVDCCQPSRAVEEWSEREWENVGKQVPQQSSLQEGYTE
jgi:hypothetical protein